MNSILYLYALHLADDALILGHRNSEWTGHGPILEQDIALSNISLDLIGQSRYFYQYAAELKADGSTEDTLAFMRNVSGYLNNLMAEQSNGDWGKTILRQFFFSAYLFPLYERLNDCSDSRIKAIAEKSLKEVTYHLRWSSEWVIRLGQGTEESHGRMSKAMLQLWKFTEELYTPVAYEYRFQDEFLNGNNIELKNEWNERVNEILKQSGLDIPVKTEMISGGKEGIHSVQLEELLRDMQFMQKTYPGLEW